MKRKLLFLSLLLILQSCFKTEKVEVVNDVDSAVVIVDSASPVLDSGRVLYDVDSASVIVDPIMSYDEALEINSSSGWRRFLEDNPNYEDVEAIQEKIIRAEVSEIAADENTGQMPTSDKIGASGSGTSIIEVENDTSCTLTLMYSGVDAKRVRIAPNSKSKVTLRSGDYTVAANACGYNYSGSESLAGEYSVVYYISSVRY